MRRLSRLLLSLLLIGAACGARAAIDPFEFPSEAERQRYQHFIEEMRCPKCQNQNLAGSDAPIATDLRRELRRLLKEGRSNQEITDYMVARYGEYILYDPPFDKKTALLWLAPAVFLVGGLITLVLIVRRRRSDVVGTVVALDAEERARVDALLAGVSQDKERRL